MNPFLETFIYISYYILIIILIVAGAVYINQNIDNLPFGMGTFGISNHESFLEGNTNETTPTECQKLQRKYVTGPNFAPIDSSEHRKMPLRNFMVKTAYNVVSPDTSLTGAVNSCSLDTCFHQGFRCLDFEVFEALDNNERLKAVVGMSEDDLVKETPTAIQKPQDTVAISSLATEDLDVVLANIANKGFSSICPCPSDPLILHMRIRGNNTALATKIVESIESNIKDRLLSVNYGFGAENVNGQIGNVPVCDLTNKIVLIFNGYEMNLVDTPIHEFSNGYSNSENIRYLNSSHISSDDTEELKQFNKYQMSFVYPYEFKDYDYGNAKMCGCQMIGVNFATKDTSIKKFIDSYNNFFEITGHSFALKHSSLRERKQTSINPKRVNDKYFQFEV